MLAELLAFDEKLFLSIYQLPHPGFLDFLMEEALRNPDDLENYTEAMAAEDDELISGVVLDS